MLIREALVEELDDEIVVLVRFVMMEPNGLKKGVLREMLTEVTPNKAERLMSIAEECALEGRSEVLLRQMARRFGPIANTYRQRVMDGSMAEMDAWADGLIDGKTLDQLFTAPPSNPS